MRVRLSVQTAEEVLPRPNVRRVIGGVIAAHHGTAAFGGEDEFLAPLGDVLANEFFTAAIVVGRINQVDPGVQYRVQDRFGLIFGHGPTAPDARAADFHRAKAQAGDFEFRAGLTRPSLKVVPFRASKFEFQHSYYPIRRLLIQPQLFIPFSKQLQLAGRKGLGPVHNGRPGYISPSSAKRGAEQE